MRTLRTIVLILAAEALVACTTNNNSAPDSGIVYFSQPRQGVVHGYVFDPEAYFGSVALCDTDCDDTPAGWMTSGWYRSAAIANANVTLVDPTDTAISATSGTDPFGAFILSGVPSAATPYYPSATATATTALLTPTGPDGTDLPPTPLPPANQYLPTVTVRPVQTRHTYCMVPDVFMASDNGILQTVASFLTFFGQTTAVADLINPSLTGGVLVLWDYAPSPWDWLIPAQGALATSPDADVQVLEVSWAPPGDGPPWQSDRGFFVVPPPGDPTAALGIGVVVLPPAAGVSTTVNVTASDTVTDDTQLRPWTFPSVQATVFPGVVSYNMLHANPLDGGVAYLGSIVTQVAPPDERLCLPDNWPQ